MSCFDRNNLPADGWGEYVKIAATKAVRMDGAFKCWTREGLMYCEDGWLALDSAGNPYPIAVDEFERIYRPQGNVYISEELAASRAVKVASPPIRRTPTQVAFLPPPDDEQDGDDAVAAR